MYAEANHALEESSGRVSSLSVDRDRVRSGTGVGPVELILALAGGREGDGASGVVGDSGTLRRVGDEGGVVRVVSILTGRIVERRTRLVGEEVVLESSDKASTSTSSRVYVVNGLMISISSVVPSSAELGRW